MSSLGMSSLGTVVVWFCPGICKCLFCIQSRYTLRMNFHKSWAKHQSWGVMGISSLDTLHVESQNWEIFCKTNTGAYHVRLHVWGPIMGRLLLKQMTKVGQSQKHPKAWWKIGPANLEPNDVFFGATLMKGKLLGGESIYL